MHYDEGRLFGSAEGFVFSDFAFFAKYFREIFSLISDCWRRIFLNFSFRTFRFSHEESKFSQNHLILSLSEKNIKNIKKVLKTFKKFKGVEGVGGGGV